MKTQSPFFETAKKTVLEMIDEKETGQYIHIYINDLLRGKDITVDEAIELSTLQSGRA